MRFSKAFTLVEILVVLAVLGILAAIVTPLLLRYNAVQELRQAQQTLIGQIDFTRSQAKRTSQSHQLFWTSDVANRTIAFTVNRIYAGTFEVAKKEIKGPIKITPADIKMNPINFSAPFGRRDVADLEITLEHTTYTDLKSIVRVAGTTGKVTPLDKF
ncbi:MAG: type II secretion system protein [Deinococcaceae bacterium]